MWNPIERTPLLAEPSNGERKGREDKTPILPLHALHTSDKPQRGVLSQMRSMTHSTLLTPSGQQMNDLREAEKKNNVEEVRNKKVLIYDSSVR
jgi:hypothetical protein